MGLPDIIVLAIVAILLILAFLSAKKHFGGKGGCCGCSGGCAGCSSGSCSAPPSAGEKGQRFQVSGMHCDNCRKAVERALAGVAGVTMAHVDLASGTALVKTSAPVSNETLVSAIRAAGYTAAPLAPAKG